MTAAEINGKKEFQEYLKNEKKFSEEEIENICSALSSNPYLYFAANSRNDQYFLSIIDQIESLKKRYQNSELITESTNLIFEFYLKEILSEDNFSKLLQILRKISDLKSFFKAKPFSTIKLALKGNSEAQYELGKFYETGDRLKKNLNKAIEWYEKAANHGNSSAEYKLGTFYESGDYLNKDINKAIEWYQKAANHGNSHAKYKLGELYFDKGHMTNDFEQATKFFSLSEKYGNAKTQEILSAEPFFTIKFALEDNPEYQYELGEFYESGIHLEKNMSKAIEWYQKAANNSNPNAAYKLGTFYELGIHLDKDIYKAIKWYQKAADYGNSDAEYKLGTFYELGIHLDKDIYKAIEWYQKVANHCNSNAEYKFGEFYLNGIISKNDFETATNYFSLAESHGNTKAQKSLSTEPFSTIKLALEDNPEYQYELGKFYESGIHLKKNMTKAIKWYERAANQENSDAEYKLGEFYLNGVISKDDFKTAIKYFSLAEKHGNIKAQEILSGEFFLTIKLALEDNSEYQYKLGTFYESGIHLEKNMTKAIEWYENAANHGNSNAEYKLGEFYFNGVISKADFETATNYFSLAESHGNLKAKEILSTEPFFTIKLALEDNSKYQYKLGTFYESGNYFDKDINKAIEWYQKAADYGNSDAEYKIGEFYLNGVISKDDSKTATKYFSLAEKHGNIKAQEILSTEPFYIIKFALEDNPECQYKLGEFYESGIHLEKNMSKAIEWYQKAATHGNSDAAHKLATFYELGIYLDKDIYKAIELYRKAASLENSDAEYKIGEFYLNGVISKADFKTAIKYFSLAESHGNLKAKEILSTEPFYTIKLALEDNSEYQYKLGKFYELGIHLEKNINKAIEWYQKAASLENSDAEYKIGEFYLNDVISKDDFKTAIKYFSLAEKHGNIKAQEILSTELFLTIKFASEDNPEYQYKLGTFYESGNHLRKNIYKAIEWYQKAANNDNPNAAYRLGELYINGLSQIKDFDLAEKYLLKAKEHGSNEAENLLTKIQQGKKYFEEAITQKTKQNYEQAITLIENAIELGYDSAEIKQTLVKTSIDGAYFQGGKQNYVEALILLRKARNLGYFTSIVENAIRDFESKEKSYFYMRQQQIKASIASNMNFDSSDDYPKAREYYYCRDNGRFGSSTYYPKEDNDDL